jgi:predicted PurR-regulated permease PerM
VAMGQDGTTVLWVIGIFVVAQSLEGYVLTPIIQQRTVRLPPALTIAAQLVLGVLLGAIGVVIAAPATAAGMVIVRELYVKETLGDQSVEEDDEGKGGSGPERPRPGQERPAES